MPRRCHGIRGDVGIAPYGTTIDRQCVGTDDLAVEQSGTSTLGVHAAAGMRLYNGAQTLGSPFGRAVTAGD